MNLSKYKKDELKTSLEAVWEYTDRMLESCEEVERSMDMDEKTKFGVDLYRSTANSIRQEIQSKLK